MRQAAERYAEMRSGKRTTERGPESKAGRQVQNREQARQVWQAGRMTSRQCRQQKPKPSSQSVVVG